MTNTLIKQKDALNNLSVNISFCTDCDLHKTRHKTCAGNGFVDKDTKKIRFLFIGEAPGAEENEQGKVFIGKSGQLLRSTLDSIGFIDYYITNTVKCRPPENRNPSTMEKDTCFQFLIEQINIINPELVICVGKIAYDTINSKFIRESYFKKHPLFDICNIWHPSYILRNGGEGSEEYKKWYDGLNDIWRRIKDGK